MAGSRALVAAVQSLAVLAAVLSAVAPAAAQRRLDGNAGVYKARISPNWLTDNKRFWYRNDLRGGRREFILVDAEQGTREPAFDQQKLADALVAAGFHDAKADRLPIEALEFKLDERLLQFRTGSRAWQCDLATYTLTEREAAIVEGERPAESRPMRTRGGSGRGSPRSGGRSPDGKWIADVKDHNVVIRSTGDDREIQLSQDGREGLAYGMPQW